MKTIDFVDNEIIKGRGYHGNAGQKRAYLHDGIVWMVKFPQSTKYLTGKHLPSYTSSPLSEYIGSHIYESLGIPVHETVLGRCREKIVVGCKDFTVDADLLDFHGIKNTVDEDIISGTFGSQTHGERLSDVLSVIQNADAFDGIRDEVTERFWDMFVTDAFIHNNDRNNGNWGLLISRYTTELAPVFDNGNAFFNKRNPSVTERRLASDRSITDDAMDILSFFTDDTDEHIKPLNFIESLQNPDCNAALLRFAERIDMKKVWEIIEEIPERIFNLDVIAAQTKELYLRVLETIIEKSFNPTLEKLAHAPIDIDKSKQTIVSLATEIPVARGASAAKAEDSLPAATKTRDDR